MSEQREPMTHEKFSQDVKNILHGNMLNAVEREAPFGFGKDLPLPVNEAGRTFSAESTLKLAMFTPRDARETGDGRWFTPKQLEDAGFERPEKGGVLIEYPQKEGEASYGIVYHASKIAGLEPENTREVTGPLVAPALSMRPERLAAEVDKIDEKYNMYVGNLVNANFKKDKAVEQEAPAKEAEQEAPAKEAEQEAPAKEAEQEAPAAPARKAYQKKEAEQEAPAAPARKAYQKKKSASFER